MTMMMTIIIMTMKMIRMPRYETGSSTSLPPVGVGGPPPPSAPPPPNLASRYFSTFNTHMKVVDSHRFVFFSSHKCILALPLFPVPSGNARGAKEPERRHSLYDSASRGQYKVSMSAGVKKKRKMPSQMQVAPQPTQKL